MRRRTIPTSESKKYWHGIGPRIMRPTWLKRAISATLGPTCSAASAPRALSARLSCCRVPTPSDEPAPSGDRRLDRTRRACRPHPRRRGMASTGKQKPRSRQHQLAPPPTLFVRAEPGREHVLIPPPEPTRQSGLRYLHHNRRRLLRGMERTRRTTRRDHYHRDTSLGIKVNN